MLLVKYKMQKAIASTPNISPYKLLSLLKIDQTQGKLQNAPSEEPKPEKGSIADLLKIIDKNKFLIDDKTSLKNNNMLEKELTLKDLDIIA